MADEDRIEIEIVLDDGTVQKGFDRVRREGKKTGRALNRVFNSRIFKGMTRGLKSIGRQLLNLRSLVIGVGSAFAAFLGGRAIIQAAARQQDAINNLNNALKLSGSFSQEASMQVQDFARNLQQVTTIGDETTIELFNLARAFARTNEEALELTKAAIELSARIGIDTESAVRNLGKSFSGLLGELGEILPSIRTLTQDQLKAGEASRFVLEQFGGSAAAQVNTFSGSIKQLSNNFGDFIERIGDVVTSSPGVVLLVKELSQLFAGLSDNVGKNRDSFLSFTNDAVVNTLKNLSTLIFIIGTVRNTFNDLNVALLKTKIFLLEIVGLFRAVQPALKFLPSVSLLGTGLNDLGLSADEASKAIGNAREEIRSLDTDTSSRVENLAALATVFGDIGDRIERDVAGGFKVGADAATDANVKIAEAKEGIIVSGSDISDALVSQFQKIKITAISVADVIISAFKTGVSDAFASLGRALVTGEKGFNEFGKSVLRTIGGLAIQLGQFFILVGTGLTATAGLLGLSGGSAIAAGIALTIFGGALQALGSGGAAAGGGAGGGEVGGDTADLSADIEEKATKVDINVEGTVLSPRDVGLQIAEILEETFDTNAVEVNTA
jgi:hypothetical protein